MKSWNQLDIVLYDIDSILLTKKLTSELQLFEQTKYIQEFAVPPA
jgi:hypothetical protein